MQGSRRCAAALLAAASLAPAAAGALTIRITDVDLAVASAPDRHRAEFPSHRVLVGDHASVNALVFHDGTLTNPLATFTTTAPTSDLAAHDRESGTLRGPNSHQLTAGEATFTKEGRFTLSIHVANQGGETADATFDIEVDLAGPATQKGAPRSESAPPGAATTVSALGFPAAPRRRAAGPAPASP